MSMNRRDFLKMASSGLAAVAVGTAGGYSLLWRGGEAMAATNVLKLSMVDALHEMTDTVQVPVWAFQLEGDVPRVPGVVIFAVEGDDVQVTVTNSLTVVHSFVVPGVVNSGNIQPGETVTLSFRAPSAGTYLYYDNNNAPMNRVMGLHGGMVVLPAIPSSPYSNPSANITSLFNDFGRASHFPGGPWDPARSWLWMVNSVDPVKNAQAKATPGMSASNFTSGYSAQYFTLSGKSGFFSSHDHMIAPFGNVGQPGLVRCLNAGLITHSMHLHGNHVYILAENEIINNRLTIKDNLWLVDVWTLPPLIGKDVIIPFIKPPDIPDSTWQRMISGTSDEVFPLDFPMHCHTEPSQTAAGGNYPSGLLTHFKIEGPFNPVDNAVVQVSRAELRLKFGKLTISGVTSLPAGSVLEIRAGSSATGTVIGTTAVKNDGSWTFTGRALKALLNKAVSVTAQGNPAQRLDVRPVIR